MNEELTYMTVDGREFRIRPGYASAMNYGDAGWIVAKHHEDQLIDDLAFFQTAELALLLVTSLGGTLMRRVEYYRCWSGNGNDSGQWDTDFIAIPADTPEDKLDEAVRTAVEKIQWTVAPPVFVGFYANAASE